MEQFNICIEGHILVKNYPKISHGVIGCQGNAESKTYFSRIFRDKYDDLSFI